MPIATISAAAKAIGVSRTTLLRLRDRGSLSSFMQPDGRVELQGLCQHVEASVQRRANSFHCKSMLSTKEIERIEALRQAGGILAERAAVHMVAAGCTADAAQEIAQELVADSWAESFAAFSDWLANE